MPPFSFIMLLLSYLCRMKVSVRIWKHPMTSKPAAGNTKGKVKQVFRFRLAASKRHGSMFLFIVLYSLCGVYFGLGLSFVPFLYLLKTLGFPNMY
jgi:hypothetical protein